MKHITVFGADWCAFCHGVRSWLEKNNFEYEYRNVDVEGREAMHAAMPDNETIPVVVLDGDAYVNPSYEQLESLLKEETPSNDATESSDDDKAYDVIMIGAGPAALSAAVYTAREDLKTLLFEKGVVGGLAAVTDKVDNYPGFPKGIEGLTLADNLREQVERFGATIELGEVQSIEGSDKHFTIHTTSGDYRAKAVLIGTGSEWMKLGIPGESEYYGRGVHNCATCDGAFYRDKRLVVVGGGNSSAQESLFLTKFASHIDILVRGDVWKASDVLIHEIEKSDKITVHFNTISEEIIGENGKVTKVKAKNTKDDQPVEFETDGVFVFIGLKPVTYFLDGTGVEIDERGFVKTDGKLETNVKGIFAAGDVRSGATMQIASAVGEGSTAALSIREHIENKG